MPRFIACLYVQEYEVVMAQSLYRRCRLAFIVGVSEPCRSVYYYIVEPGVMPYAAYEVNG